MGAQNRITKDKYNQIKAFLDQNAKNYNKTANLDEAACKKFGIGDTTSRAIRNTEDYVAYCERKFRFHGNPKKKTPAKRPVTAKFPPLGKLPRKNPDEPKCGGIGVPVVVMSDVLKSLHSIHKEQGVHLAHLRSLHETLGETNSIAGKSYINQDIMEEKITAISHRLQLHLVLEIVLLVLIAAVAVYMEVK